MEALSNRGKLVIGNENFEAHYGKTAVVKTSKAHKMQKDETAARKPLGDLTNKSSFFPGISSKKIKAPKQQLNGEDKEKLNIREEGFLHDHSQCIKAQHNTSLSSFLDLVLPNHDSVIRARTQEAEQAKADPCSPRFYPELEDMYMSDDSDILKSTTPLNSPPTSPDNCNFLESPPLMEPVELMLKDD